LRYRDGRPLTSRRYDHLWRRVGEHLPWVAAQGVSIHWLRHTTLTWVERHFGYGTARAYAGHTDTTGPATATYIKADLTDVATALAAMTGQPHVTQAGCSWWKPDGHRTARLRVWASHRPQIRSGWSTIHSGHRWRGHSNLDHSVQGRIHHQNVEWQGHLPEAPPIDRQQRNRHR
jgi:hypothetical protein